MKATDRAEFELTPASGNDLDRIEELLRSSKLTTEGVRDMLGSMIVARIEGRIVGVAGLEEHGKQGLLRSVAVEPAFRSKGLGRHLSERIKRMASERGIRHLYLLTEGADGFFAGIGFEVVDRASVDGPVATSDEFARLCPSSATAMYLALPVATDEGEK